MYIRFTILITLLLTFTIFATPQTLKEQQKTLLARNRERCVIIDTDSGRLTGTIISRNLILTNFHGIEAGSKIGVIHETQGIIDWQREAKILAADSDKDLVLLVADTPDLPIIKFSTELELWQEVFYIGYPKGIVRKGATAEKDTPLKNTVPGIITAISDTRIYTNINPGKGMSGSMLYDLNSGNAVGIQVELVGTNEDNFHSSGAIMAKNVLAFLKETRKNLNDSLKERLDKILEYSEGT